MVATKALAAGTLVLVEQPLFFVFSQDSVDRPVHDSTSSELGLCCPDTQCHHLTSSDYAVQQTIRQVIELFRLVFPSAVNQT